MHETVINWSQVNFLENLALTGASRTEDFRDLGSREEK